MTADFEKESVTIEIFLPKAAKVQVKVSDKVSPGDVVASQEEKAQEFDLSKLLSVPAKRVGKYLLSSLGTQVKKGQILAEKRGLFKKRNFASPIDGVLESLSEKGILKIREKKEKREIKTPAKGKVKKIEEGRLLIETPVVKAPGDWAIGKSIWGLLKIASAKEKAGFKDLGEEVEDKLLVFKGEIPTALAYKAEALGAAGLVVGQADRQIKPDELAILALGGKKGVIPDLLWKALEGFEGQEAKILTGKNLLIICS